VLNNVCLQSLSKSVPKLQNAPFGCSFLMLRPAKFISV
jgi:hypothetical protein